jgi:membrane protein
LGKQPENTSVEVADEIDPWETMNLGDVVHHQGRSPDAARFRPEPTGGAAPPGDTDGPPSQEMIPRQERGDVGEDHEKRIARRPEGPAHERDPGLKATLKRTATEFREDNGTDTAAALTYYGVLSLFPGVIALVSIVGLFADPRTITDDLTSMVRTLGPPSAVDALRGPIQSVAAGRGRAGVLLAVGIVSALWSASGYIGAFSRASNVIYEVEEGRSFRKLRPMQLLVSLIQVLLLAVVAVSLMISGPLARAAGSALGMGSTAVLAWQVAKWPVMAAVVLLLLALLYYAAPNAKLRGWRSVLPGALLALVVWVLASAIFAGYVTNFGSYNKTYGALGGVIMFLVWIWLSNLAVLFGAQFNAERERSREIAEGTPGAERELQIPMREEPEPDKRSRTA